MTVRAVNVLGIEWGRRSASVVVGEERVLQKTKKKLMSGARGRRRRHTHVIDKSLEDCFHVSPALGIGLHLFLRCAVR